MRVELGQGVWYDPDAKGYIMYEVPDPGVQPLEVDGVPLQPKTEHHCSLVPARKLAGDDFELEQQIVDTVQTWIQQNVLEFDRYTGEVYVCHKPNDEGEQQTTVIAGVAIKGLSGLWQKVRQVCPDFTDPEQLHVTVLKSANSMYGIGVNTAADMAAYCKPRHDLFAQLFPDGPNEA